MKSVLYDPNAHRKNKIRHAKYKRFARATKVITYSIYDLPPDHELRRKYEPTKKNESTEGGNAS